MRNKLISGLIAFIALIVIILPPAEMTSQADTVGEAQSVIDGIIGYKLSETGSSSIQDWINGDLSANAGVSSEYYIMALSQSGGSYDFSAYENALSAYVSSNNVPSASTRQKYALALVSTGSTNGYISSTLGDSIGEQGIMSWIYGLHMLNNGYTGAYTAQQAVDYIVSQQYSDGGWALWGGAGDVDVTAMAVQALAPYYGQNSDITLAVDRAVELLSSRQLDTGEYSSYGTSNPESAAQVVTALSALGIDCMSDARFIKDGHTLLDGIMRYSLGDGSFAHTLGGGYNSNATVQVFYAMIAYMRQQSGLAPLYVFDCRAPIQTVPEPEQPATQTQQPVTDSQTPVQTAPSDGTSAPEQSVTETASTTTAAQTVTSIAAMITEPSSLPAVTTTSAVQSTVSDTTTTIIAVRQISSGGGYKPTVALIIIGSAAVIAVILLVIGKRHWKNFLALAIVAAAGIAFVQLTDFRSAEEYYTAPEEKKNTVGTITMTIRCETIAGETDKEYIPDDGVILDVTEFDISEGETAYDLLTQAARAYAIQLDSRGSGEMAYVTGINYIYEYDFGDLSGWIFRVNGETPSVGSGAYKLSGGDRVEWLYSKNMGNDLQ